MNTGNRKIRDDGAKCRNTIITSKMPKEIAKSTKLVITAEAGTIIRGKYTFDIRFVLEIRLLPASDRAVEKNWHGRRPLKTSKGYGQYELFARVASRPQT